MMNAHKRPTSIADSIELIGKWWLPDNSDTSQKLFGTLTFNTNGEGRLKLLGSFDNFMSPPGNEYKVIFGECHPSKRVSLFNAMSLGTNVNLNNKELGLTEISINEFWIGDVFFSDKKDVKFDSFSFGINNLEKWHNMRCFKGNLDNNSKTFSLLYDHPEDVVLFSDDKVNIVLTYAIVPITSSVDQISISIEHAGRITIKSKNGRMPYYGEKDSFNFYAYAIYSFIALCIGDATYIYGHQGIIQRNQVTIGDMRYFPEIEIEFFYRQTINSNMMKSRNRFEMLFPYHEIASDYLTVIKTFVQKYAELSIYINQLVEIRNTTSFDMHSLPELVYLFEGIERNLYRDQNKDFCEKQKDTQKDIAMLESIFKFCNEEQKQWIGHRLDPHMSLHDRFLVAIDEMLPVFPYLNDNTSLRLIKYLKDQRNLHAHAKGNNLRDNFDLYVFIFHWLSLLLIAMVFNACGMRKERILQCLSDKAEYGQCKRTIENLLRENTSHEK